MNQQTMFDNYLEEQKRLLPNMLIYEQEIIPLNIPIFEGDGEDFQESIIRYNTDKWREELESTAKEIKYSYCFFRAYLDLKELYSNDLNSNQFLRSYELLTFEIPLWTSILLDVMYTFREKFAHFFLEIYERQLSHPKISGSMLTHENITFFLLLKALKKKKEEPNVILTADDTKKVFSILKSLCFKLLELRSKFKHRSMPAIETLGTGPSIVAGKMVTDNKFELSIENEPHFNYEQIIREIKEILDGFNKGINDLSSLSVFIS